MSRSGYNDYDDIGAEWSMIRWRGAVASAIRGKRGQAFLRELLAAFDTLPEKRLIADSFANPDSGHVCALGSVAKVRGIDVAAEFGYDPEDDDLDQHHVAGVFGIPHSLACEIMYENDEGGPHNETAEQRFVRMRRWIERRLIEWDEPKQEGL